MSSRRGQGQQGISGVAEVSYKKEESGEPATPKTDSSERALAVILGEDSGGTAQKVRVDSQGRIELGADLDIGDINLLDSNDTVIDPATEPTLASIDTKLVALATDANDKLRVDLAAQSDAPLSITDNGNFTVSSLPSLPAGGNNIGEVNVAEEQNETGLTQGQNTVSTSGTAEALNGGTSLSVPDGQAVSIKALNGNTGAVYVGDSSVTTSNGHELQPDQSVSIYVTDVSTIFIDADNNGDGISWLVEQ